MKVIETPAPFRQILDFDTECRPMHYSDWRPESQITAYGWAFLGESEIPGTGIVLPEAYVQSRVLNQDLSNEREILEAFLEAYDRADVLMGHYIRKHDLPLLNDHCIRLGLKPISERPRKWTIDTKMDFVQVKALGLSQDNLSVMLKLDDKKHHMSGSDWRTANSLTPEGQAEAVERVTSDVRQNMALYTALRQREALRPMVQWPLSIRHWPR